MEGVFGSQRLFRGIMDAISHPALPVPTFCSGEELLLGIADTLLDHEVGFSVVGESVQEYLQAEIQKRTRAQSVDISQADFVFVIGASSQGAIRECKVGTPAYPDQGATIIYLPLVQSPVVDLSAKGPGIAQEIKLSVEGLKQDELVQIFESNTQFPLGVDVLILQGNSLIALPRSITFKIHGLQ